MKIISDNLRNFYKKDFLNYKGVFLSGNNRGLILSRSKFLQHKFNEVKNNSTHKIVLNYEQILKNPVILVQELNSYNLFASSKIIIIDNVTNNLPSSLIKILENSDNSNLILFHGLDFTSTSTTKKYFDTSEDYVSISCYTQTREEIRYFLNNMFNKQKIVLESESIKDFIVDNLVGDYENFLSEIQKIELFSLSNNVLKLEDIKALLNKTDATDVIEIIELILKKDVINLLEVIKTYENSNIIGLIRNISNQFFKMIKVKSLVLEGKNFIEAIKVLKINIFFKYENIFKNCIKNYSLKTLIQILEDLTNLEIKCKSSNIKHKILLNKWAATLLKADHL